MDYSNIISGLLGAMLGGFLTALVTALMDKRNEKESRLFSAKLEAYKEFAAHLENRFVSLAQNKDLELTTLAEVSSKSLLVSSPELNKELKNFLISVSGVYKLCCSPDFDPNKEKNIFEKLWKDADEIENLMRKDLGF